MSHISQIIYMFHVFSPADDRTNEFTDDLKDALKVYEEFKERYGSARLFMEIFLSDEDYKNDTVALEDCLLRYENEEE